MSLGPETANACALSTKPLLSSLLLTQALKVAKNVCAYQYIVDGQLALITPVAMLGLSQVLVVDCMSTLQKVHGYFSPQVPLYGLIWAVYPSHAKLVSQYSGDTLYTAHMHSVARMHEK